MIEYIKGKLIDLTPTEIVGETAGGVAYKCLMSVQSYSAYHEQSATEVTVYIHHYLREDDEQYFGFFSKDERSLFQLLISASGVGAATARIMLSSLTTDELRTAISSEDVNRIKVVKGIGVKTAQRIIVDLKDKVIKGGGADTSSATLIAVNNSQVVDEASAALVMLGFAKTAVMKAISAVMKTHPSAKTEEIIKLALQCL